MGERTKRDDFLEELPYGIKEWAWANEMEVAASLLCLMPNPDIFRLTTSMGMLENLRELRAKGEPTS